MQRAVILSSGCSCCWRCVTAGQQRCKRTGKGQGRCERVASCCRCQAHGIAVEMWERPTLLLLAGIVRHTLILCPQQAMSPRPACARAV